MIRKIWILIALLLFGQSTLSATQYGSVIVSRVISVYDGDTFRVDIDSLSPIVGKNIAIRLEGVDTPEIRGQCQYENDLALLARDFVRDKLRNAKEIKLNDIQRGKVFIDGVSLEKELLENELAYRYNGGKKTSWCK